MTEQEFIKIVDETQGLVLSAIEKNLPERFYHAIDDIAQETYFRAYKSLKKNKFKGKSTVQTWVYTIARNETLRMYKKLDREEKKFNRSIDKCSCLFVQTAIQIDFFLHQDRKFVVPFLSVLSSAIFLL